MDPSKKKDSFHIFKLITACLFLLSSFNSSTKRKEVMDLEYQSIFEIDHLLLGGPFSGRVDDIVVIGSNENNSSDVRLYMRHGAHVVAFNVSSIGTSINWNRLWNGQLFENAQRTSYPLKAYPWLVTDTMLDDGSDGIVLRNENGMAFYRFDRNNAKVQGLSRDTNLRDLYGWAETDQSIVLIGRFYRNTQLVGVMTLKKLPNQNDPVIRFYAANQKRLERREPHPLFALRTASTDTSWMSNATHFYVADMQRNGHDMIIVRKPIHLEIYHFDDAYSLQQVAKVSLVDNTLAGFDDQFFFVNLTGQRLLDIVHFTRHGLFVYQQRSANTISTLQDYTLINYHSAFSETAGWMPEYGQSIRLVDTDGDGRHDLLFTGQKGLTILAFDAIRLTWMTLLDPSSLDSTAQRFAIVVGATKSMVYNGKKESFLLTVDEENRLYLGRLLMKSKPVSIVLPVATTHHAVQTVYRSTAKIPSHVKQMSAAASQRPILRWTEQYDNPLSLKDIIDPVSGSIHFALPIFKASSHSVYDPVLPHTISLSYDSQRATVSNLAGLGWTLSLPDNYISIDYRNSIFTEDWAFQLIINGVAFQLEPVSTTERHLLVFRQTNTNCDAQYHRKEERWIIQTETETMTYGSEGVVAGVRWNLHWPHWRGSGNDVKSLQRIPVAWYLIRRRIKATGRILTYHYDTDNVLDETNRSWTAAIRLKKIESSTTITFDYAIKQKDEYQSFHHLEINQNNALVFPVPLRQSHYLAACHITTEDYSQTMQFVYQTDGKGRRLLTAIEQPITADVRESIFLFNYEDAVEADGLLLNEIQLPSGLKVHFQFDKVAAVHAPVSYLSVAHPVDEQPAIAYSQAYAVMAFRRRHLPDMIQVKVMAIDLTETLAELTSVPVKTQQSYEVRAYVDYCLVLFKIEGKQQMCLYHHSFHDRVSKWNKDPTCYWTDGLMQSSEAAIAFIDTDTVRILELNKQVSKWVEHVLKLPSSNVIRLEMFNHLVVGYDDVQLFICHPQQSTGQWQLTNIERLNDLFNGGSSIVRKFSLPPEMEKMLIETLKTDLLQVSSNTVVLASLHLNDEQQLLLKVHLYLLDVEFNVIHRREFTVQGERILELRHRFHHEGTTYQLAYHVTTNERFFQLRIVNVSGERVKEMLSTMTQNVNAHELQSKENVKLQKLNDFKTYDEEQQKQFEAWLKMANNTETPDPKVTTPEMETTSRQPHSCDDESYAPCNTYCHKMEALSKMHGATLDQATRVKKDWDTCNAQDWKEKWEEGRVKELIEFTGNQRNTIARLQHEWNANGIDITSSESVSRDALSNINDSEAFQQLFNQLFLINWSLHRVTMTPQGLQAGNATLIQMTGEDWHLQELAASSKASGNESTSAHLGTSFVLEEMAVDREIRHWTLYAQNAGETHEKTGPPLHQLAISPPDSLISRYPVYLAYQTGTNNTVVIFFSDNGQTMGEIHTFRNEQLMMGVCSYQQVATLAKRHSPERMEFVVRSLRSIPNTSGQHVVQRVQTSNNDASLRRSIGYQWDNDGRGNVTVIIVPGNDRKLAGWMKQRWTIGDQPSAGWTRGASHMFDADGRKVRDIKNDTEEDDSDHSETVGSIAWDAKKQRIISDFSPYELRHQMVSYYGFERYEVNDSAARWLFMASDVVEGEFSLTGNNHLRLKSNNPNSKLEGVFIPAQQNINYVASCWIRYSDGVNSLASTSEMNQITRHFKAVVSVEDIKVIALLGRVMRKVADWSYVEVVIDFDTIRQLCHDNGIQLKHDSKFRIRLKVETGRQDGQVSDLDVDHVRFTPMAHDFKATVYHVTNGQPVAVIGSSGSISQTVYYNDRKMAVIDDVTLDRQVEQVSTSTLTGRLLPKPIAMMDTQPPCRITFYPQNGALYEPFDGYAWRNRWNDPQSDPSAWTIAPGRLWHNHHQTHGIVSQDASVLFGIDSSSAAIRCYYSLTSSISSVTWKLPLGDIQLKRNSNEMFNSTLNFKQSQSNIITRLPNSGELILLAEGQRFFIWIDSILLMDVILPARITWSSLTFEAQGDSFIDDCIFMANPRVEMEYLNEWTEKMQTIRLESETSVLIHQTLYDELARPAITTKATRLTSDSNSGKPLLAYYRDFIEGSIDPSDPLSVWHSHRLRGQVDRANIADNGVAYFRVQYAANPLNEKYIEGQAGPEFAINGPFAKTFRTSSNIDMVENHFPTNRGFRHSVEQLANGTQKVAVFDANDNRVALYIYVEGYDHLLSTYEYDSNNKLIKILPPMYHVQARTLTKSGPLTNQADASSGNDPSSADEMRWQQTYATVMKYADDRLISKMTSDAGIFNYYYNRAGQIRLEVHSSGVDSDKIDSVVFYEYDNDNNDDPTVVRTGYLKDMPMSREHFQTSLANGTLMNANNYQLIDRTDASRHRHYDASFLRGERNATFATFNMNNHTIVEKMRWDGQDRLVEFKRIDGHVDLQVSKTYYPHSKQLRSIDYPTMDDHQPIRLQHRYNPLGQLIELNVDGHRDAVVRFSYHAGGQLAGEYFHPGSGHREFNRTFDYNSPGYLERITDRYLTESIFYTQGGYGQSGYGDGIIMKTRFNATWPPNADWRWFQVTDSSKLGLQSQQHSSSAQLCFNALKRNGYMTKTGRPLKDYNYPFSGDGQAWMPLVCGGRNGQQLAKVLAQKRMPRIYGHRYAYGHHQELVKAKYFSDETENNALPFQPDTLAEKTGLNRQQSRDIWKKLDSAGFIVTDQRNSNWLASIANPARSLVRSGDLKSILKPAGGTADDMTLYQPFIETMILNDIGRGRLQLVNVQDFQKMALQWKGIDGLPLTDDGFRHVIENIHRLLVKEKNLLAWLDPKLADIFQPANYSLFLSNVIGTVCQRFAYGLGQHPFDVASYDIDANGNHHKFHTGYNGYTFAYNDEKPNQIRSVRMQELGQPDDNNEMQMLHDSQGNVIQALHKGIRRIEYNAASKRTTSIYLTDGRIVHFTYDGHGERTLKQVLAKDGRVTQETHYVRDEDGRVLFDHRTTYSPLMAPLPAVKTAYIYGPRGLVGFMRNGSFHSVWTDHSGSIRLVLKDGQVVAAYDYLPYGQPMRSYGSDPAAAISYRYTGQEWDEETGLYNYHARLYDPDIGRFYQPDPRSQYFSPYKYVGNSPVSLIDPDGELAVMLITSVIFALTGAYLGGASANDNWNPAQWDYKSSKTWLGIITGGLIGGLLPTMAQFSLMKIGILTATKTLAPITLISAAKLGLLTTGTLTTMYLSAAAANRSFDPTKWAFDRPHTYDAFLQGMATFLGIVSGGAAVHSFTKHIAKLSSISRVLVPLTRVATFLSTTGFAYHNAVFANNGELNPLKWDFSDPNTLYALLQGIDSGIGLPADAYQMSRGAVKAITKRYKNLRPILRLVNVKQLRTIVPVLKQFRGPIGKMAAASLTAYLVTSSANEDFQPNGWHGSSLATYEGFLNGLILGLSARKMLSYGTKRLAKNLKTEYKRIQPSITYARLAIKRALKRIRSVRIKIKHLFKKSSKLNVEKLPGQLAGSFHMLDLDLAGNPVKSVDGAPNRLTDDAGDHVKNNQNQVSHCRRKRGDFNPNPCVFGVGESQRTKSKGVLNEMQIQSIDDHFKQHDLQLIDDVKLTGPENHGSPSNRKIDIEIDVDLERQTNLNQHVVILKESTIKIQSIELDGVKETNANAELPVKNAPIMDFADQNINRKEVNANADLPVKNGELKPKINDLNSQLVIEDNRKSKIMDDHLDSDDTVHKKEPEVLNENEAVDNQPSTNEENISTDGELIPTNDQVSVLTVIDKTDVDQHLWSWKNNLKIRGIHLDFNHNKTDSHKSDNGQHQIDNTVNVGDLINVGKRWRRSPLLQNTSYPNIQQQPSRVDRGQPCPVQSVTSGGSRPHSWIHLISLNSIASLTSIFEFITPKQQLDLPQLSKSNKNDYRDTTIGNCYTFSTGAAVVCYGHAGQTSVFAQSPSAEDSPLPLQQHQDTFRQCRPVEWYGKPSVTCQGDEKTTFIHTPYETTAANYFNAIDGWLLLTCAAPGFYRQIGKFIGHVKNVWTGSETVSEPVGEECKQSWQKQLQQVELLVAKCEIHHVKWAQPMVEEIRQQIALLIDKENVKTMDHVRAVKTMTERLTALIEDVGELVDFRSEDNLMFYDCLEEVNGEPNETNNSAESMSARLHQLMCNLKNI